MPTSATLFCYDRYFLHHSCNVLKIIQPNMQSLWGSLDNTATEILPFRKEEQSPEQLWVRSFAGDSATQLSKRIKFKGSSASCCSRYGTPFAGYVTWKAPLSPALRAPAGQCVTQPSVAMQVVNYWLLLQCAWETKFTADEKVCKSQGGCQKWENAQIANIDTDRVFVFLQRDVWAKIVEVLNLSERCRARWQELITTGRNCAG